MSNNAIGRSSASGSRASHTSVQSQSQSHSHSQQSVERTSSARINDNDPDSSVRSLERTSGSRVYANYPERTGSSVYFTPSHSGQSFQRSYSSRINTSRPTSVERIGSSTITDKRSSKNAQSVDQMNADEQSIGSINGESSSQKIPDPGPPRCVRGDTPGSSSAKSSLLKSDVRRWKRMHEETTMHNLAAQRTTKKNETLASKEAARKEARKIPVEILCKDWLTHTEASVETRAYMVEKVMPTLILGVEKLLNTVDDRGLAKPEAETSYSPDFNPINFLAQYMHRNNPRYSNFSEASPYVRGLRKVVEELKTQLFAMEDNRLARIKAEAKRKREEREQKEFLKQKEKERRQNVINAQFEEWHIKPTSQKVELAVVQNALRSFQEIMEHLPQELQDAARFDQPLEPTDETGQTLTGPAFDEYLVKHVEHFPPEVFEEFQQHMSKCAAAQRDIARRENRRIELTNLFIRCDHSGIGLLDRHRVLNLFEKFWDAFEESEFFRNPRRWPVVEVEEVDGSISDDEDETRFKKPEDSQEESAPPEGGTDAEDKARDDSREEEGEKATVTHTTPENSVKGQEQSAGEGETGGSSMPTKEFKEEFKDGDNEGEKDQSEQDEESKREGSEHVDGEKNQSEQELESKRVGSEHGDTSEDAEKNQIEQDEESKREGNEHRDGTGEKNQTEQDEESKREGNEQRDATGEKNQTEQDEESKREGNEHRDATGEKNQTEQDEESTTGRSEHEEEESKKDGNETIDKTKEEIPEVDQNENGDTKVEKEKSAGENEAVDKEKGQEKDSIDNKDPSQEEESKKEGSENVDVEKDKCENRAGSGEEGTETSAEQEGTNAVEPPSADLAETTVQSLQSDVQNTAADSSHANDQTDKDTVQLESDTDQQEQDSTAQDGAHKEDPPTGGEGLSSGGDSKEEPASEQRNSAEVREEELGGETLPAPHDDKADGTSVEAKKPEEVSLSEERPEGSQERKAETSETEERPEGSQERNAETSETEDTDKSEGRQEDLLENRSSKSRIALEETKSGMGSNAASQLPSTTEQGAQGEASKTSQPKTPAEPGLSEETLKTEGEGSVTEASEAQKPSLVELQSAYAKEKSDLRLASGQQRSHAKLAAFDESNLNASQFVQLIETFLGEKPEDQAFEKLTAFIQEGYEETEEEKISRLVKARKENQLASRKIRLDALFEKWDNDGSGYLDLNEIHNNLLKFKDGIEKEAINKARKQLKKENKFVDNRLSKKEFRIYMELVADSLPGTDNLEDIMEYLGKNLERSYAELVRGEARKKWLLNIRGTALTCGVTLDPVYKAVFQSLYHDAEAHGNEKRISANIAILERSAHPERGEFCLHYTACTPEDAEYVLNQELYPDMTNISFKVVQDGKPIHVPRVSSHGGIHFWNTDRPTWEREGSFIVLPLKDPKRRVFGVLGIDTLIDPHKKSIFITHEINFFQGVAQNFSMAYSIVDLRRKLLRITESAISWIKRRAQNVVDITVYIVEPAKADDYVLHRMLTTDDKGVPVQPKDPMVRLERKDSLFRDYLFKCIDNSETVTADAYGKRHLAYPLRNNEGKAIALVDICIGEAKKLPPHENQEMQRMLRLLQQAHKEITREFHGEEHQQVLDAEKCEEGRMNIMFDRLMLSELRENLAKLDVMAYAELKAYHSPPPVIMSILQATLAVFYRSLARRGEFNDWNNVKSYINPELIQKIESFDPTKEAGTVSTDLVENYLKDVPHGEVAKHGSLPAQYLYNWLFVCLSLIEHSRKMGLHEDPFSESGNFQAMSGCDPFGSVICIPDKYIRRRSSVGTALEESEEGRCSELGAKTYSSLLLNI